MRNLFLAVWVSLFCCSGLTGKVWAAENSIEYKVKAAFLLNFAKFTTWPEEFWPDDKADFQLSVVGSNPFGSALAGVEEKQIAGKAIRLYISPSLSEEVGQSQLLFVCKSEEKELENVIGFTSEKPIVTVSDIEGFAAAGGIFELRSVNGRLSFIVNNSKAKEKGIRISSSLLKLAIEVL